MVEPRRARGYQNQGAASGPTKIEGRNLLVRGLNALAAAVCTALGTPLLAATRLRGGTANAARDTASFGAEVIGAARAEDAPRWSSRRRTRQPYCGAVHRVGARFSAAVNTDPKSAVIIAISQQALEAIRYSRDLTPSAPLPVSDAYIRPPRCRTRRSP
jgi:hypothetical protein